MNSRISTWIRRYPILAFYFLAFAITWLGWVPQAAHSHGLFPFDSPIFYILGGVGPLLAVIIMLKIIHGKVDYGALFRPLAYWRVGVIWYFIALFGYAAMWIAALALSGDLRVELMKLGPPLTLLSGFLVSFVAAIPEQVAWRGFALPRLQSRYNALVSSLIVGVLWALWHLPLLVMKGTVMSTYSIIPYFLQVIALSVVYTWIFNSTQGSLLIVTLFHAASNTVGPFVGIEQTLVVSIVAAVIVIVFGAAHLSRRRKQLVQDGSLGVAPKAHQNIIHK